MKKINVLIFSFIASLLFACLPSYGAEPISDSELSTRLTALINSEERSEQNRARNGARHPLETLMFFGLQPSQTVVEIWPGGQGGWYRSILEPFFSNGPGRYVPVLDESAFPGELAEVPDGSIDLVLVFRAHGFMIYDKPAQAYYDAMFRMLKPGGVFGIVDHRGRESVPQDPRAEDGYVNQSHVMMLAKQAGFQFVESAEINANPLDTKDYPDGVYSLPPTLRSSVLDSVLNRGLRERVLSIGESDRMTLKFRKP